VKDWAEVEAFALALPGTEASTSYRQPAVKVAGKAFVSTGHEAGSFHVRAPHDEKAMLIETDPDSFWQTAHYATWPGLLVRYGGADPERVRIVVTRAWWDAAPRAVRQAFGPRP
jgi:hypothetical protein